MTRLDHLHELVEARGDATAHIERDLGDVQRRARRHRRRSVLAGTFTSIVVVSTVALVATAIGVNKHHDENVSSSAAATGQTPATWQPAPFSRSISGGPVVQAAMAPPAIMFGPYGTERRWIQPADCAAPVNVSLTSPSGEADLHVAGLTRTAGTKLALAVSWELNPVGAPRPTLFLDEVVVVVRPVAGATYRLLNGDQTLDTIEGSGGLLALYAQVDSGLPASTPNIPPGLSDGIHVQELTGGGVVLDRKPIRQQAGSTTPAHCSPPSSPSGLAPATGAGSATGAAIAGVIASLTPSGAAPIEGLSNVDDPGGSLHTLMSGNQATRATLTTAAHDVHLVSSTHAWVRYGLRRPAGTTATQPDAFTDWAELHKTNGQWKVTAQSYCVLASAIGTRCPDQPVYALVSGTGQPIQAPGGN